MEDKTVSILLVGIGGYSNAYVNVLKNYEGEKKFKIQGIVDVRPENSSHIDWIREQKIPEYCTMEEFYAEKTADLAIISTPIQFHAKQTCFALCNGSNVLCEKPMCSTIEDAYEIIRTKNETGRFAAIGYDWSYNKAMLDFKRDIIIGLFGKPLRFKTMVLRTRFHPYRSKSWAGLIKDEMGNMILDSVAHNSAAHFLHNMFFILGEEMDQSTILKEMTAELYRSCDIETFDTAAVRVITKEDVELLFYATHAVENLQYGPVFSYEFENAVVTYDHNDKEDRNIKAVFNDGTIKIYDFAKDRFDDKLWNCIDALREKIPIACPAEAAFAEVLCITKMYEQITDIVKIPEEFITTDEATKLTRVKDMDKIFIKCYENSILPYEAGISWAKKGSEILFKEGNS